MKRSKIFTAAIALVIALAAAICLSACDKTVQDTQINDAFALVAESDYLKVEVSDNSGVVYIYDNGKVTDPYDLGIKFEDVVGEKGDAVKLTTDNLKEGYKCDKDAESGKVSLTAELVNTSSLGNIDGATISLKANTVEKTVESCVITYTENGYRVSIYLA